MIRTNIELFPIHKEELFNNKKISKIIDDKHISIFNLLYTPYPHFIII